MKTGNQFWHAYERKKREFYNRNLTPDEYERELEEWLDANEPRQDTSERLTHDL